MLESLSEDFNYILLFDKYIRYEIYFVDIMFIVKRKINYNNLIYVFSFTGESIPQETTVIAEKTKRKGETSNPSSRQRVKMNA